MKLVYGNKSNRCFSILSEQSHKFSPGEVVEEFIPEDLFLEVGFGETSDSEVKKFINSFNDKEYKKILLDEIMNSIEKYLNMDKVPQDLVGKTTYLGALKVYKVVKSLR